MIFQVTFSIISNIIFTNEICFKFQETKVEKKKKPIEPKTKTTKVPLEVDVGRKDLPDFTPEQITQFKEMWDFKIF